MILISVICLIFLIDYFYDIKNNTHILHFLNSLIISIFSLFFIIIKFSNNLSESGGKLSSEDGNEESNNKKNTKEISPDKIKKDANVIDENDLPPKVETFDIDNINKKDITLKEVFKFQKNSYNERDYDQISYSDWEKQSKEFKEEYKRTEINNEEKTINRLKLQESPGGSPGQKQESLNLNYVMSEKKDKETAIKQTKEEIIITCGTLLAATEKDTKDSFIDASKSANFNSYGGSSKGMGNKSENNDKSNSGDERND